MRALIFAILLTGCAARRPQPDYSRLNAVQGALLADRDAFAAGTLPEATVKPYVAAVEAYNRAHDLWAVHQLAESLHQGERYSLKRFRLQLEEATRATSSYLQAKGVRP